MTTFDNIPNIRKGLGFPVGDSFSSETQQNVERWFSSVSDMSHKSFLNHLESHNQAQKATESNIKKTVIAALGLCHSWDYAYNNGRRFSSEGFKIASVFINKTEYLPECTVDLSEDLKRMALREAEGGQLHSGREFGRVAWNNLAIYPNVHFTLERILELAEPRFGIFVNKDRDCLKAGLALPFMMSWASSLAESTPEFTCMAKIEVDGEDTIELSNHLSMEVPLAPNDIRGRNK